MLQKTNGIILHSLKYSDSANIVTIFTSEFGRVVYMVHGANKKKSKCRNAFLQALTILNMDVYHSPNKTIQSIKDIRIAFPLTGIPNHPIKNSLALFISELLYKCIKQTVADENMYYFLENSIQALDCCEEGLANFHLVFLLKLTRYLGFEPNMEDKQFKYFDLMNGVVTTSKTIHNHYLTPEATENFVRIMQADFTNLKTISLHRDERYELLENIIEYYKLHLTDFYGLNSLPIFHALFD